MLDVPDGSLARLVGMIATTSITKDTLQRCMAVLLASCLDPLCRSSIGGGFGVPDNGVLTDPAVDAGTQASQDAGVPDVVMQDTSVEPSVCIPKQEVCNYLDDDCDGIIDNGMPLQWDTGNCGACGVTCMRPHTNFACVYGSCVFQGCDAPYENADGDWDNGCEAMFDAGIPDIVDTGDALTDTGHSCD